MPSAPLLNGCRSMSCGEMVLFGDVWTTLSVRQRTLIIAPLSSKLRWMLWDCSYAKFHDWAKLAYSTTIGDFADWDHSCYATPVTKEFRSRSFSFHCSVGEAGSGFFLYLLDGFWSTFGERIGFSDFSCPYRMQILHSFAIRSISLRNEGDEHDIVFFVA